MGFSLGGRDQRKKKRYVALNQVALEVGDIEEALAFYSRLLDFELRSRSGASAFIHLGRRGGELRDPR
jgi:catechol 2,3-dioxygenase-like lactoylglutathione lyase family enzyme